MINMTLNKNIKNNQKGITLIELLVVISIIGILAAVTMPNLFAAVDRAKGARDLANLKNAKTQALMDMIDGEDDGIVTYSKLFVAAEKAIAANPSLMGLGSGSNRNKKIAEAIAEQMNQEVYSPSYQLYSITGFEVPNASKWYIAAREDGIYIKADHVEQDVIEKFGEEIGVGKPVKKKLVDADPSLKNEKIYWNGVSGSKRKDGVIIDIGHVYILLYKY